MLKYPYHKPEVTKSDILKAKIGVSRSKMVEPLLKSRILTQVNYISLFLQSYYREKDISFYKGAMSYYESTLSSTLYLKLTKKDIIFGRFKN